MNNEVPKRATGHVATRRVDLAMPMIPDLDGDSLDLEKLGGKHLTTYIKYPGIQVGDTVTPQFYGCAATGEVIDRERSPIIIPDLEPDGSFKLELDNALLIQLDKGFVFYSYFVEVIHRTDPIGQALERMEQALEQVRQSPEQMKQAPEQTAQAPDGQSLRLFFYVNKQVAPAESLPPVHVIDSDGLVIDLNRVGENVVIVTSAFAAMSAGDEVRLELKFESESQTLRKTLTQADLGKPMVWQPDDNLLYFFDWVELSWSITYVDGGPMSVSPVQRFTILEGNPVQLPSLPPPRVPDEADGLIDPGGFPDGLPVEVDDYGARHADELLLQAQSANGGSYRTTFRLERTLLDSRRLQFRLPAPWLQANNGQQVALTWQWARIGAAADSAPLELTLRKPLNLLLPIVPGVIPREPEPPEVPDPDIDDYGFIKDARSLTGGTYVEIPADSETGGGKVTVHWYGFGTTGKFCTDEPSASHNLRYTIPSTAVPANIGKRLKVYYDVELPGRAVQRSPVYGVKIEDLGSVSYRSVLCPDARDGVLSLARVPMEVTFKLTHDSWHFFAQGQIVRVWVTGKSQPGQPPLPREVIRDDEAVSEDEWYEGELIMKLPKAFLENVQLNTFIEVSGGVSFDEGASFKAITPAIFLVQA
ncbi:hypothetical protein [Pseudomonas alabamensis]|jgi:hypothetical protein|uniref:hypothetical protein n=1 Tax=Pseudomonas alabamensis TaxID=3064349 RepID=UPI0011A41B15